MTHNSVCFTFMEVLRVEFTTNFIIKLIKLECLVLIWLYLCPLGAALVKDLWTAPH